MKKLSLIFAVAIMMAVIVSCNKKEDVIQPEKTYAKFVSGEVIIQNGDVTLKSAPVGVTEWLYMYKQTSITPTFALVNGTEFLTGSAPALFWAASGNNPGNFPASQAVYSNYTPAMQVRMVAKTVNASGTPAYLGIFDVFPNQASFPVHIYGKRLGDVLTLNTDALTALPGYTNMSFDVVYTTSIIDVNTTMVTSGPTTASAWPTYTYSSTPSVTTILNATKNLGARTVYDELGFKTTGTITINIHVDTTTITVQTQAAPMGYGLAITLTTDKVGWYDSGTMVIGHEDIGVQTASIPVN